MKNRAPFYFFLIAFCAAPLASVWADDDPVDANQSQPAAESAAPAPAAPAPEEKSNASQAADEAVQDLAEIMQAQPAVQPPAETVHPNLGYEQSEEATDALNDSIQPPAEELTAPVAAAATENDDVSQPVQVEKESLKAERIVSGPVQPSNFEFIRDAILQNHRKKFWLEQERLEAFKRGDKSSVRELAGEINELKQKDKELRRSLSTVAIS